MISAEPLIGLFTANHHVVHIVLIRSAYLPENKVFLYQRPTPGGLWKDKSKPPPQESFTEEVFDCSDLGQVYDFAESIPEMHSGYHYSSTAIEWKYLIDAINDNRDGKPFLPKVSLDDGIKAVEMGITSQAHISNNNGTARSGIKLSPVKASPTKSVENLLIPLINNLDVGRYEINLSPSKESELLRKEYDATSVIIGAINQ